MKRKPLFHSFALLSALAVSSGYVEGAHPIVPVGGTYVYTQNFDTMFSPATPGAVATSAANGNNWVDGVTVPDWFFHYTSNSSSTPTGVFGGASFVHSGNDGSAAPTLTLNSMGAAGSTDRAFGSPSTTARCEQSGIVVFQNTSTRPVLISDIGYNGEVLRTNSTAGTTESIHVYYKTGASQAAVLTMTAENLTAAAAGAKFGGLEINPTAGFFLTGWTGISQATWTYFNPNAATPVNEVFPVLATGLTGLRVEAGQFVAIRFSNPNGAGTDALMGIDDLQVTFTEVNIAVSPAVSNVVRNVQGTPLNPLDDTIDFDLTVTGVGPVNPAGWQVASPAALSTTGTYDTAKAMSVPILEFSGPNHTLDILVHDQGNPATNATVQVTAPWCSLTAAVSNVTRSDNATADPSDDTWGYTLTVNGQYTGSGWTSDNAAAPSGSYGTAVTITGLSVVAVPSETTNIFDASDPSCTATVSASPPRIVGTTNFGTEQPLLATFTAPSTWNVDEFLKTQTMVSGGGAPPKVYRSETIDLTGVGEVLFTGVLAVHDATSGFETPDTFNAQLIIDGNTAAPVSLITPYDIVTPDGVLTGAELSPANPGPPPTSGAGDWTYNLSAVIPATANSVQLVISGNNDSSNESMTVQSLLFQIAPHSLQASLSGTPVFNNQGTVDPGDDKFTQGVNITPVSNPPSSTGWTSNQTPASGLYTDANPVIFGPFFLSPVPTVLALTDNFNPAAATSLNLNSPVPDLISSLVDGSVQRNNNGTPGDVADDTVTFQLNISAPIGGPSFILEAQPSTATASSSALTASSQTVTITLSNVPDHGVVNVIVADASYPTTSQDRYAITVPEEAVTEYVVATRNFGGSTKVVTAPGPVPVEWSNFPSIPALQMRNGGALAAVTSEELDLTSVGEVNFSATLRVVDTSTGFEETDTFKAELLIDGVPTSVISPANDANADGILIGTELALPNGVFTYTLSGTIPAGANRVQLVITAINNSNSEVVIVENASFLAATPPPIVPGGGEMSTNVGIAAKLRASVLVGNSSGGEGPLTVSGVQSPSLRGGSVTLQGGLIVYEPAAGFSGLDSFTYTITDGTQTANGTVFVAVGTPSDATNNLLGMVPEGDGQRIGGMGIPGRIYQWQHSSDLSTWTAMGDGSVCPANGMMTVVDPGPLPATRFYRLVEVGQAP